MLLQGTTLLVLSLALSAQAWTTIAPLTVEVQSQPSNPTKSYGVFNQSILSGNWDYYDVTVNKGYSFITIMMNRSVAEGDPDLIFYNYHETNVSYYKALASDRPSGETFHSITYPLTYTVGNVTKDTLKFTIGVEAWGSGNTSYNLAVAVSTCPATIGFLEAKDGQPDDITFSAMPCGGAHGTCNSVTQTCACKPNKEGTAQYVLKDCSAADFKHVLQNGETVEALVPPPTTEGTYSSVYYNFSVDSHVYEAIISWEGDQITPTDTPDGTPAAANKGKLSNRAIITVGLDSYPTGSYHTANYYPKSIWYSAANNQQIMIPRASIDKDVAIMGHSSWGNPAANYVIRIQWYANSSVPSSMPATGNLFLNKRFCPNDCSGRGTCNNQTNVCTCETNSDGSPKFGGLGCETDKNAMRPTIYATNADGSTNITQQGETFSATLEAQNVEYYIIPALGAKVAAELSINVTLTSKDSHRYCPSFPLIKTSKGTAEPIFDTKSYTCNKQGEVITTLSLCGSNYDSMSVYTLGVFANGLSNINYTVSVNAYTTTATADLVTCRSSLQALEVEKTLLQTKIKELENQLNTKKTGTPGATVAGIAIGTFVLGLCLASIIMHIFCKPKAPASTINLASYEGLSTPRGGENLLDAPVSKDENNRL